MAERQAAPSPASARPQRHWPSDDAASGGPWQDLLHLIRQHAPNSTQLVGLLTLVVSGGILLALAGITFTGAALALVFLGPVLLLTSPVWVPAAALVFGATAVVLSACGFGVAAVAGATWVYRYAIGRHPVGSDRVDYARSRIADTASHVKDYAREYGGYLKGRVKDAAPGA
ncbi:oleosin-like [Curcuma longa]|uniref:oleosin-like n=1 Tax=Curcuma longa TaxID=136217 RepID=UPI003D9F4C27